MISDNASTDGTRKSAGGSPEDRRVVYQRHATNVGLLNNFLSAAGTRPGTYVRWLGDDDAIEPDYVSQVLDVFAQDERRVMVTTQIGYSTPRASRPRHGLRPVDAGVGDPVERFAGDAPAAHGRLRAPSTRSTRRCAASVATLPRRNMLREDQIFAARLALAGPWGHVAAPLAGRPRHEGTASSLAGLLGVPGWHRHVRILLQCQELSHWVARSSLDPAQRRQARAEILSFYGRGKRIKARRGVAKLERLAGRPLGLSPSGAR